MQVGWVEKSSRSSTNKIKLFFKWRFRFHRRCCCLSSLSACFGSFHSHFKKLRAPTLPRRLKIFGRASHLCTSDTFSPERHLHCREQRRDFHSSLTNCFLFYSISTWTKVQIPRTRLREVANDVSVIAPFRQSRPSYSACTVQTRHEKRAVVISRPRLKCSKPLFWPKGTVYKDKTLCIKRKQKPDFVGKLNSRYYIVNILAYVICTDIRRTRFNTPFTWFCHMKTAGANGRRYEEAEKEHVLSAWNTVIVIWFS